MKIEHDFGSLRVIVGEPSHDHMRVVVRVNSGVDWVSSDIHINEWDRMKVSIDKMFKKAYELSPSYTPV